jgi:hypothetical protein
MLALGSNPGGPFKRVEKATYTLADDGADVGKALSFAEWCGRSRSRTKREKLAPKSLARSGRPGTLSGYTWATPVIWAAAWRLWERERVIPDPQKASVAIASVYRERYTVHTKRAPVVWFVSGSDHVDK